MSQVSKYPVNKDIEERMFNIFYRVLANLRSKEQVKEFMLDLLTQTEQVMMAKRLAIALLLVKGKGYIYIRDMLKVSTSTILLTKQWLLLGGSGYKKAAEQVIKEEDIEEFFDKLEELYQRLTIPQQGKDWSTIRSKQWKERTRKNRKRRL